MGVLFGLLSRLGALITNTILLPFRMIQSIITGVGGFIGSLFGIGGGAPQANPEKRAKGGLVGYASGGHVRGGGTSTSDSIFAMLSRGEFVVNARDAAANLPLLQALNSGESPALDLLIRKSPMGQLMSKSMGDGALGSPLPMPPAPIFSNPGNFSSGGSAATEDREIKVEINLNIQNITLGAGSSSEQAQEFLDAIGPKLQREIRDALRDMVEKAK
jgi:hypothetical protein